MPITYEASDRFTAINGKQVHTNEAGSGHALMCFHGGGPGANAWDNTRHNIDALAEHFQVILLDMPNYGLSEPIDALPDETQDRMQARFLVDFMNERGIERTHFYGTSMSTDAVLRFALEHPERTGKVVLKAPGGMGIPSLLSTSPPDGIKALGVFRENPTRENMVEIMKLFVPRNDLLSEEMIEARFQMALRTEEIRARNAVVAPLPFAKLQHEVAALQAPVLVVWGHQDRMVSMDGALICLGSIPNVQVHLWGGGTGHFMEWERPSEFNQVVLSFLLAD